MTKQLSFSMIIRVISIVLLLIAIADMPYGYYMFLRWIVCSGCAYSAFISAKLEKKFWLVSLALLAILFNPIAPIFLTKEIWVVIDILASVFLLISIFVLHERKGNETS